MSEAHSDFFSVQVSEEAYQRSVTNEGREIGDIQILELDIYHNSKENSKLASLWTAPGILSLEGSGLEPGVITLVSGRPGSSLTLEEDRASLQTDEGKSVADVSVRAIQVPVEGDVGDGDDVGGFKLKLQCARWMSPGDPEPANIVLKVTPNDVEAMVEGLNEKYTEGKATWQISAFKQHKMDARNCKFLVKAIITRLDEAIERKSRELVKQADFEEVHQTRLKAARTNPKTLANLQNCKSGRFTALSAETTEAEIDENQKRLSDLKDWIDLLKKVKAALTL